MTGIFERYLTGCRAPMIWYQCNRFGHYELFNDENDETIYFQDDHDYPDLAITFGWNGKIISNKRLKEARIDPNDLISSSIYSAIQFLDENEGDRVQDPGYFDTEDVLL